LEWDEYSHFGMITLDGLGVVDGLGHARPRVGLSPQRKSLAVRRGSSDRNRSTPRLVAALQKEHEIGRHGAKVSRARADAQLGRSATTGTGGGRPRPSLSCTLTSRADTMKPDRQAPASGRGTAWP
jgi:hypothetical protein